MSDELVIKNGIVVPLQEIEVLVSRSGGPGGQHVNKSNTRITLRWNIKRTQALDEQQKDRVLSNLANIITNEGDIVIHYGASRSQQQNKEMALNILAQKIRRALYVPKKRIKTRQSKAAKEARLQSKMQHSQIKKMRSKIIRED